MKQTALEYLRGLANAYALTEQVTISVATLRDALEERQAVPSTGEMRQVAQKIADELEKWYPIRVYPVSVDALRDILTDAPEIIALQQAKETAERERDHFKAALDALQDMPAKATITLDASSFEASIQRVKNSVLKLAYCVHGVSLSGTCVSCDHERGIHYHSGKQQAYDSCTHGRGQYGTRCQVCEPELYERTKWRILSEFAQSSHE